MKLTVADRLRNAWRAITMPSCGRFLDVDLLMRRIELYGDRRRHDDAAGAASLMAAIKSQLAGREEES